MESGGATGTLQLMVLTFVTVNSQSRKSNFFTIPHSLFQRPPADQEAWGHRVQDCCVIGAEKRRERGETIPFALGNKYPLFLPFGCLPRKLLYYITCLWSSWSVPECSTNFSQRALQCISVYFWNDQQFNILSLEKIPDLLDYERSLFPLRDSQRKRTSEQARNRLFTLAARHASHV